MEHEAVSRTLPTQEVIQESSAPSAMPTTVLTTSSEGISPEEEAYLIKAAREVGVKFPKPM